MEQVREKLDQLVVRLDELKTAHYGGGEAEAGTTGQKPYPGLDEVIEVVREGFSTIARAWPEQQRH